MIKSHTHNRQGAAVTNFDTQLPEPHAQLAKDTLKDPYIFDFLTLEKPFRERELETELIGHLERFLLELGAGFAFVGRQAHLDVAGEDFYIDLLFYHMPGQKSGAPGIRPAWPGQTHRHLRIRVDPGPAGQPEIHSADH